MRNTPSAAELGAGLAAAPSLEERLQHAVAHAPGRIAFSTSLGLEDQAILHAIAATGAPIEVFTLDTGRLFPETIDLIAESERRYGLRIRVIAPDAAEAEILVARDGISGFRHSVEARKACCHVRKVAPLRRALSGAGAWVTGLRRGQSHGRGSIPFAEDDAALGLVKINPIADWSLPQLEAYIAANRIPVNALHAQGFPSIGCQPCTRAVAPGEDIRAGRWWWEADAERFAGKECGLHNRRPY